MQRHFVELSHGHFILLQSQSASVLHAVATPFLVKCDGQPLLALSGPIISSLPPARDDTSCSLSPGKDEQHEGGNDTGENTKAVRCKDYVSSEEIAGQKEETIANGEEAAPTPYHLMP